MHEIEDFNATFQKAELLRRGHLKMISSITEIHPTRVSAIIKGDTMVSKEQKAKVAQAIMQLLHEQMEEIQAAIS